MREIKFRVYDKDLAKYLEGCEIDSLMAELSAEGDSRAVIIKQICPARYIFEQYTGLKDKNGKGIYEGDIVTLNGEWEEIEHGDWSIVTFENGCFRVGDGYENEAGSYLSDWRIIGNIHENPELLKEEK